MERWEVFCTLVPLLTFFRLGFTVLSTNEFLLFAFFIMRKMYGFGKVTGVGYLEARLETYVRPSVSLFQKGTNAVSSVVV